MTTTLPPTGRADALHDAVTGRMPAVGYLLPPPQPVSPAPSTDASSDGPSAGVQAQSAPRSLVDLVTAHPARGHRATAVFVLQLLGIVVVALAAVGTFDWEMDPWGVFAHAGPAPLVQPDQRADKVRMLEAAPNPDVVLLGSSRMLRYDPALIVRGTHLRGFNASVAGSDVLDAAAFTSWLAERHRSGHGPMPHVVYGIGVEEFRAQPSAAVLARVPELARQQGLATVPFHAISAARAADLQMRWMPLLGLSTLRASLRSFGRELGGGPPPVESRFRTRWAANGMQLRGHSDATLQHGQAGYREVRTFRRQYLDFYERRVSGTELALGARQQLDHLLAVANAEGDAPVLFLLPMRTGLAQELGPIGRDQQTAQVRAYLHGLHASYRFTWRDLSRHAPGDPQRGWYDDVHPRISTAHLVLAQLRRELGGAVLRGDASRAARARR